MTSAKKHSCFCGDFNCVAKNEQDIISGLPHRVSEANQLKKLINDLGVKDGWSFSSW